MKHPEVDALAGQLKDLLRAAAVVYWRPDEMGAALTLGCAPAGCIGSAFKRPQAQQSNDVALATGPQAPLWAPLALRRWLAQDIDATLLIHNGVFGGILVVWTAGEPLLPQDQDHVKTLARFALTSLRVKSHSDEVHRLAMALGTSQQVINIADAMPQGIVLVPEPNSPGYVNHAAAALLGLTPGAVDMEHLSACLGRLAQRAVNTKEVQAQIRTLAADADAATTLPCVWRFLTPPTSLRVSLSPMTAANPNSPGGWLWLLEDVSSAEADQSRLRLAASVFTSAHEGIAITDARGTIVEVNDTFSDITGYARADAIGQTLGLLQPARQSAEFCATVWQALTGAGHWTGEVWSQRKNGEAYAELTTLSAVRDDEGATQNYVALFSDITLLKAQRDQLQHMAHFDALTQLPNRSLLSDRLQQAIVQSQRRATAVAVVFVDLDGFKQINDVHGHDAGDVVLKTLSQRMKSVLRECDTLARVGGDEFVAVLTDLPHLDACVPLLGRLLQAASSEWVIQGASGPVTLHVSASMGVTTYPKDGASATELISHADQAMYQAKASGRNRYCLYGASTSHGKD